MQKNDEDFEADLLILNGLSAILRQNKSVFLLN